MDRIDRLEQPKITAEDRALFAVAALVINDEGLTRLLAEKTGVKWTDDLRDEARKVADYWLQAWDQELLEAIPEQPRPHTVAGFTMRRAVARISRNDPCPCGSEKKYKRCCYEKDQERLRHSTDVVGKTEAELGAELEPYLTEERMLKLQAHQIVKLDPQKIDPKLLDTYFSLLIAHLLLERAAEALETFGFREDLVQVWTDVIYRATVQGDRAIIRRIAAWHPDTAKGTTDHLYTGTGLILLEDDPAKMLEEALAAAIRGLGYEDVGGMCGLTEAILLSKFRPFGIYIARSMIPLLPRKEALKMLERIFEIRDAMNLPPDDPYSDVLDKRFAEEVVDDGKDAAALREAGRRLKDKADEVRRIKDELEHLRREVSRREKKATPTAAATAPVGTESGELRETRIEDLRLKVMELKSVLQGRHEERTTLRRELEQAHTDLEKLRQKQSGVPVDSPPGADAEERLLLPGDVSGNQPVRLLEFPRRFHDTLESLPKPVARGAMTMLGRLAAGEPPAYVGVVRLKACPATLRQRIGADHRLLFRLHPERVEVVDLINRRDLERRIRTL